MSGSIPGSGRFPGEGTGYPLQYSWACLVAQLVNNPPANQETWVRSLGWEDPPEKGKATHASILAWRIPWDHKEANTTESLSLSLLIVSILLVKKLNTIFSYKKNPHHMIASLYLFTICVLSLCWCYVCCTYSYFSSLIKDLISWPPIFISYSMNFVQQ